MGILNGIGIVNSLLAGTLSGAALQTYLGTGSNYASFVQAINSRSQARAIAESPTAMAAVAQSAKAMNALCIGTVPRAIMVASAYATTAIAGTSIATAKYALAVVGIDPAGFADMTAVAASSTAMNAVIASSTAMNAVAASSTAMTAVAASSTAMNAVIASSTAKMACYNADTALNAFAASGTAMAALRAAGQYTLVGPFNASTSPVTITGPNAAGSYILLGVSSSDAGGTGQTISVATRRAGSSVANTGLTVGATNASNAQTTTNAIPVATPFTFTASTDIGYTWYFGILRCDV